MAVNFWQLQERAKKHTTRYVAVFIALTLLVSYGAEQAMRFFAEGSYESDFPLVGVSFALLTFLTAIFQYAMYSSQGGSYVAEALGARRVDPAGASFAETQLLNIVEEIAIAAGVSMPAVYILPAAEINAFAAGLSEKKAAVTVSAGALKLLSRDELQGVVAHEFGHIKNGDMKISLRLAAMVMGFFVILYFGIRLLQMLSWSGAGRRSSDDRRGGNPLAVAAMIFVVAGSIMWFFGSVLKACVSREREYLADASAVQFTRNPEGIASALRKIAGYSTSDMPKAGAPYSHLYFDDRTELTSLFATHPPIAKRIAALEGRKFIPEEWHIPKAS